MAGRAGVLARVPVRRAIATKGDAAFLAGAEMDPGRSDLYAFLALQPARRYDRIDREKMRAESSHIQPLFAQDMVSGWDCDRAFAHGGSDAFHISRADITNGEHPGQARFKEMRGTG